MSAVAVSPMAFNSPCWCLLQEVRVPETLEAFNRSDALATTKGTRKNEVRQQEQQEGKNE